MPEPAMRATGWRGATWGKALVGGVLLAAGLLGALGAAWGYALFIISAALLGTGALAFAVFCLTSRGDADAGRRLFSGLLVAGGWAYVYAWCAFAGYYGLETLQGRMELRWIMFGPAALVALVILEHGIYRKLVVGNLPTLERYRRYISRENSDPVAMRETLINDVVLQTALFSTGKLRWLRHALIFWGFVLLCLTELLAVGFRDAWPAFGLSEVWREPGHPLRLGFDFAYDLFSLMILAGCVLALVWRAMVNGKPEQKFSDTPTVLFLLFVVVSGFLLEAMRIAGGAPDLHNAFSFVGFALAGVLPAGAWLGATGYEISWLVHVLGSCLFIAYVPVKRLIHSCATPMGRLMNSQKGMLAAKKKAVLSGLLVHRTRQP